MPWPDVSEKDCQEGTSLEYLRRFHLVWPTQKLQESWVVHAGQVELGKVALGRDGYQGPVSASSLAAKSFSCMGSFPARASGPEKSRHATGCHRIAA